jgi:hypothetical protein
MLRSVYLHNQSRHFAEEIGYERAARRLTSELEAIQTAIAQPSPEFALFLGLLPSQQAGD